MENLRIRRLDLPGIREAYRLLIRDTFPDNERKPLAMIEQAFLRGRYIGFGAEREGALLAAAFFAVLPGEEGTDALLDYLSVRKDLRGQGIGGGFLGALAKAELPAFANALVEVEDPDAAEGEAKRLRQRRLNFYLRCGFQETPVCAEVYRVGYRILRYPLPGAGDTAAIYRAICRDILPQGMYERFFRIKSSSRR